MGLPWVRLDSNIAHHDKMLALLAEKEGHRAACLYMFALAWSGGQATDGYIAAVAVPVLHGQPRHAEMLVRHHLWEKVTGGYRIRNYAARQETATVSELKRDIARKAGKKSACVRLHGPECGCWRYEEAG